MDHENETGPGGAASRLGRAAAARFAGRGPTSRRTRVGSVAMSAGVFASSVARPVAVRRQLAVIRRQVDAPGDVRVRSFDPVARPPRWWVPPASADASMERSEPVDLPARGLKLVSGPPPSERTHTPGRFAETMRSTEVRVKRMKEVTDVGSLPGTGTKLTTPAAVRRRMAPQVPAGSSRGASPGTAQGDGEAHRATSGAAPRVARPRAVPSTAVTRPPTASRGAAPGRPPRMSLLRRAWLGRQTAAGGGNAAAATVDAEGSRAPSATGRDTVNAANVAGASDTAGVADRAAAASAPHAPASDDSVASAAPAPAPLRRALLGADPAPPVMAARPVPALRRAAAALPGPDGPQAIRVRRLMDAARPPVGYRPRAAATGGPMAAARPGAVADAHATGSVHADIASSPAPGLPQQPVRRSTGAPAGAAAASGGEQGTATAAAPSPVAPSPAAPSPFASPAAGGFETVEGHAPDVDTPDAGVTGAAPAVPATESRGPVVLRSLAAAAHRSAAFFAPAAGATGIVPASVQWMAATAAGGAPRVLATRSGAAMHRTGAAGETPTVRRSLAGQGDVPALGRQLATQAPAVAPAGSRNVPAPTVAAPALLPSAAGRSAPRSGSPISRAASLAPMPSAIRRTALNSGSRTGTRAAAGTPAVGSASQVAPLGHGSSAHTSPAAVAAGDVHPSRTPAFFAARDFRPGALAYLSRVALTGTHVPAGAPGPDSLPPRDSAQPPRAPRSALRRRLRTGADGAPRNPVSPGMVAAGPVRLSVLPLAAPSGGPPAAGDPDGHSAPAMTPGIGATVPGPSSAAGGATVRRVMDVSGRGIAPPSGLVAPVRTADVPGAAASHRTAGPSAASGSRPAGEVARPQSREAISAREWGSTPPLRRSMRHAHQRGRTTAHTDIRPATTDIMRFSRVNPPRGIVMPASRADTAQAAPRNAAPRASGPPSPSTAAAFAEDSVVRRFLQIGAHRASSTSPGQATSPGGRTQSDGVSSGSEPSSSGGALAMSSFYEPEPAPRSGPLDSMGSSDSIQASLNSREWAQLVDEVSRRIETRVMSELARRGRRAMPRPM